MHWMKLQLHPVSVRAVPLQVMSAPFEVVEFLAVVRADFPSPAEDLGQRRIDLTAKLIKHSHLMRHSTAGRRIADSRGHIRNV